MAGLGQVNDNVYGHHISPHGDGRRRPARVDARSRSTPVIFAHARLYKEDGARGGEIRSGLNVGTVNSMVSDRPHRLRF